MLVGRDHRSAHDMTGILFSCFAVISFCPNEGKTINVKWYNVVGTIDINLHMFKFHTYGQKSSKMSVPANILTVSIKKLKKTKNNMWHLIRIKNFEQSAYSYFLTVIIKIVPI